MRIAIIFNCLRGGGAEKIAGYLSKYLAQEHEVYLFLEDPKDIVYENGGQIVDVGRDGVEYLEYHVRRAKIKYDIDVSISHMEIFNHINVRTKGRDAVILTEHTHQNLRRPREYANEVQNKNLYPLADHIVTVSKGVRNEIIETTGTDLNNVSTIYNFFDCKKTRRMSKADVNWPFGINSYEFDGYKLIISIGRLAEEKDHIRLLRQFEILHKKNKKTKLVIIGSGELENSLREMIIHSRLDDSVFILPYMANPFPILKSADVFVFSSRYEGYGNVLLEAMALHVPVISVDCLSGPREVLDDNIDYREKVVGWKIARRGILVTDHESDKTGETGYLAEAIEIVLNDGELRNRIVDSATEWIESRSNTELLQQWMQCIEKAVKKNSGKLQNNSVSLIKGRHYVIYGAGQYAKRIYKELRKKEIYIDAFIVSNKENATEELFGRPVYQRELLLDSTKEYEVIMGVANWEYVNQICKWFIDNNMYNIIFYALSKSETEV